MLKRRFSEQFIKDLSPPKTGRTTVGDTAIPGLLLRVTAGGAKSFCVVYRRGPQLRRYTIGSFPRIDVAGARELARAAFFKIAGGGDPAAEKRAERSAPAAEMVATAFGRYLAKQAKPNLAASFAAEIEGIFNRDVLPVWGKRPIVSITKGDVIALVDRKAEKSPVQANRVLARLRAFFNWAIAKDILKANPADGVEPPTKEKARDRVLSDDEIRAFWAATDAIGWPFGSIAKLLLLTAQRRDEVAGMAWREVNLADRLWSLPPERAKNQQGHFVPLSDQALTIISALPRIDSKAGLIFTTNGKTAVSGFSKAKERIDALMVEALRKAAEDRRDDPEDVRLEDWILHDLRRSATTGMARLKFPPHIVDKILNHVSGSIRGVAAVYNKHEYLDERRAALAAWARYVEALTAGAGVTNIVPFAATQ